MSTKLEDRIVEFTKLAAACPEKLQEKCFELLLADYLAHSHGRASTGDQHEEPELGTLKKEPDAQQRDIRLNDLHVKARRFMEKYGLDISDINQVLYRDGTEFLPLYDTLGSSQTAECQVRIALLQSLVNGLKTGNFEFDGERVRLECGTRKCYDSDHFAHYFKRNAGLFDKFQKYDKGKPVIALGLDGLRRLAELIKELG